MTRDQAIRKVMACLAMAQCSSGNPHEAANAMRQAQALMRQYGLDEVDLASGQVKGFKAATRQRGATPPQSIARLVNVVAAAYGCKPILELDQGSTRITFFGSPAQAEIAAYTFTVLRRLLERDKRAFTARMRKASSKVKRGEVFALGWVVAVQSLSDYAPLDPERQRQLDLAVVRQLGELGTAQARQLAKVGKEPNEDMVRGFMAGNKARVAKGMGQSRPELEQL